MPPATPTATQGSGASTHPKWPQKVRGATRARVANHCAGFGEKPGPGGGSENPWGCTTPRSTRLRSHHHPPTAQATPTASAPATAAGRRLRRPPRHTASAYAAVIHAGRKSAKPFVSRARPAATPARRAVRRERSPVATCASANVTTPTRAMSSPSFVTVAPTWATPGTAMASTAAAVAVATPPSRRAVQ